MSTLFVQMTIRASVCEEQGGGWVMTCAEMPDWSTYIGSDHTEHQATLLGAVMAFKERARRFDAQYDYERDATRQERQKAAHAAYKDSP